MSKKIYFAEPLPSLILKGKKNTTWRLDESHPNRSSEINNLQVGDLLSLCNMKKTEFAQANVKSIKQTSFGFLSAEDKNGHEKFKSVKDMYDIYSRYYKRKITSDTKIKVIKFQMDSYKLNSHQLQDNQV